MRIGAFILGILGGIAGVVGGAVASGIGITRAILPQVHGFGIFGLGFVAMFAGVLGIIGGVLALFAPRSAGVIMIVSLVIGLLASLGAYLVAAIMLGVGAVLAFMAGREAAPPPSATTGEYTGTPGVQH